MIVRPTPSSQHLITQPDHAALSAHFMRHWRADGLQESSYRSLILLAIAEHDNGWREIDVAPLIDSTTGRILDFIHAPDDVRREVWPRGVNRLAATPYAAALVAQHSLQIYQRYRDDPRWASFFVMMEATRGRHLHAASVSLDQLTRDYFFLRIGDLASLTFCNGWRDVQPDESGYTVHLLDDDRLVVSPDPFSGAQVPFSITARKMPAQTYDTPDGARAAFQEAPEIILTGVSFGVSRFRGS